MYYFRRINPDAWENRPADDADSISDLGTINHELSVWEVQEDLSDLLDMALAYAMTRDKREGLTYALLNPDEIERQQNWKVEIQSQASDTLYTKKKDHHKNFMLHNLNDMGRMALHINSLVASENKERVGYIDEITLENHLKTKIASNEITEAEISLKGRWKKVLNDYKKEQSQKQTG